jgi:butyryl-CoA dehydrogenase
MDFLLSEDQHAFRETVREFALHEMKPYAAEWDAKHIFPINTLKKAAALGLAAIYVKPEFGGSGLSRLDGVVIFEELATACPSTTAFLSIHNMVSWIIDQFGSHEIRKKWLPALVTMEKFCSYSMTEPNAGSDAASLTTTAKRDGNEYVINGAKAFVSGGSASDVYLCMVRTGEPGPKGISALLIEKDTPGITFGKHEEKMGWHSQPTTMIFFDNCRVPVSNRVGAEGEGFKIALSGLNGGRINIAACSLGGARECLNITRRYMLERSQFQQKLAEFEGLQFRFADMLTRLDASRLMVYRAARSLDHHHANAIMHCAMAKQFATDLCFMICNDALQLHGGYGYLRDYPIERYFRDLRVHQILEGTNEIMRLIIARHALKEEMEI